MVRIDDASTAGRLIRMLGEMVDLKRISQFEADAIIDLAKQGWSTSAPTRPASLDAHYVHRGRDPGASAEVVFSKDDPIRGSELRTAVINLLSMHGYSTFADLSQKTKTEVLLHPGMGAISALEIEEALKRRGLSLAVRRLYPNVA